MRTILLAASIAIVCSPLGSLPSNAADFSHAKRVYVPATAFDRRVDFTTMRDYQAVSSSVPTAPKSGAKYSLAPRTSATSSGIVPPPPPYPGATLASTAKSVQSQIKKAASSPQVQSAVANLKKKAAELAQSGKFDEAKQMAARVLSMSPQDKTVLKSMATSTLERAKQFVNSSDFDKAMQYARESLAYDGNNVEAKKMVEGLLIKQGGNPSSAEERLKNGDLLLSQGRNDEAFVEYTSALKLKPSAEAHVGIGNVALRAGQKDRAKNEYHAALDVDPNSSLAYRQLGLMKLGQGDVVGANAALSRSLVLNPKDKTASKSLVELWQQQVSKVPGANSHLGLARAYQLSGDLQSAQTEYRTVVRLDPENSHLPAARQAFKLALSRQEAEKNVEAARNLEDHNDISDAYQKVHEAVRLSPGDAEYRVYQGQLLEKMQKYQGAREAYLNALKINPRHSLAAERLKALPPDAVSVAPQFATPPIQTFAPAPAIAAASNGAANGMSAMPAPTHDPVANISNFAVALRNQMVVGKAQIEQVEDVAHGMLKQLVPGATAAAPQLAAAAPTPGPTGAEPAAAASSAADSSTGSVSDVLASAQAALAAAKGMVGKGGSPAAAAAPAVATTAAAPATKGVSSTLKQMDNLRQQNQQLQAQLKKMHDALSKLRGQTAPIPQVADSGTTTIPASVAVPNPELDSILASPTAVATPANAAFEPPLAPPISESMAAAATTNANLAVLNGLQAIAPQMDPTANAMAVATPSPLLRSEAAVPSAVSLQLENASPKLGQVELSVLLRNDSDASFLLPTNKLRAVINYSNRRPAEVKAMFNDAAVPPHGAIRGVIRVPFDKVDPTADLVIPELLPPGAPSRDVHLITSMAFR